MVLPSDSSVWRSFANLSQSCSQFGLKYPAMICRGFASCPGLSVAEETSGFALSWLASAGILSTAFCDVTELVVICYPLSSVFRFTRNKGDSFLFIIIARVGEPGTVGHGKSATQATNRQRYKVFSLPILNYACMPLKHSRSQVKPSETRAPCGRP